MERREHDQGGKGNPYEDQDIKDSEDCGIIVSMKTLENNALMRIYRNDLTVPAPLKDTMKKSSDNLTTSNKIKGLQGFVAP